MRFRRLRFDVWLCLLLSAAVAFGLGKAAEYFVNTSHESYVQDHQVPAGEVGGIAGEEVFRAQDVDDLLSHDLFTVVSPGIEYQNRGAGYYKGMYFYALTLPSGECVAACVNSDGVQHLGSDIYSGDSILPVGQVVWEELFTDPDFLEQIQHSRPLARTDFYVDMVGAASRLAEDQYKETPVLAVQLLSVAVCFPLFHAMGSHFGLLPYFFPPKGRRRNREQEPWES